MEGNPFDKPTPASSPEENELSKEIFVQAGFLSDIKKGKKTVELRLEYRSFSNIQPGQVIEFKSAESVVGTRVRVTAIRRYETIDTLLKGEDMKKVAPRLREDRVAFNLNRFFSVTADIKKYGLMAIEFRKI